MRFLFTQLNAAFDLVNDNTLQLVHYFPHSVEKYSNY